MFEYFWRLQRPKMLAGTFNEGSNCNDNAAQLHWRWKLGKPGTDLATKQRLREKTHRLHDTQHYTFTE